MEPNIICPSCGSSDVMMFYEVDNVPVHSVMLLPTREEAISYPTRDIDLGFCTTCGFIYNTLYDPNAHHYSEQYEETQGYSPTFNTFAKNLATHMIERYNLRNKKIIEIGCGKGEFLTLLCQLGDNHGIGIDPSYVRERSLSGYDERVSFINELYTEKHTHLKCDFLCCKMTLEHIHNTGELIETVRKATHDTPDTTIFFQIPNVLRILEEAAFWDVYYEHCSYFSPGSLARLFRLHHFDMLDLWCDYGDQYLMIEAKPAAGNDTQHAAEESINTLKTLVHDFPLKAYEKRDTWIRTVRDTYNEGKRVVLWGSGSKGVAFLTTLGIRDEITYTVDVNPNKHGTFMAGTGQEIVSPDFLVSYQPDLVVVMNPIYEEEIRHDLQQRGLSPRIVSCQ